MEILSFIALLSTVVRVAAHGYVDNATIDGKIYQVCPLYANMPAHHRAVSRYYTHSNKFYQPYGDSYMGNNAASVPFPYQHLIFQTFWKEEC